MTRTLRHMSHVFFASFMATILWSCTAMPQHPADLILRSEPAGVVGMLGSTTSEVSVQEVGVESHHQLGQRANWESKHTRLEFVAVAEGMSDGAAFLFNLWVKQSANGLQMWRGDVEGISAGPSDIVNVIIPGWWALAKSSTSVVAKALFEMDGRVDGKSLAIYFTAELLINTAGVQIQQMLVNPYAEFGGNRVKVTSWVFDNKS